MKKILVITQKVDDGDDLLGFFTSWLAGLAGRFDRIDVIALGTGSFSLPDNVHVHSLGKERGVSKLVQLATMLKLLWRYSSGRSSIFAHMSPIFAVIAWPFAKVRGCRLVLWYLHRSNTLKLRIAEKLVDVIVTADAASLRLKSKRIISLGHGIDTARFRVARDWTVLDRRPLRILSVGRLSPIKDFRTLIRESALLRDSDTDIEVRIVGRAIMPGDHAYEQELKEAVARSGVGDIVHFAGFVPHSSILNEYAWADIVVGCTPSGGIDKVLLEAMAAGCIAMSSNDVMAASFKPYTDKLIFGFGDAGSLTDKISSLSDFQNMSTALIANVKAGHELAVLTAKLAEIL
jgi:glycosyltransferase involved in cell wall biosynthesis